MGPTQAIISKADLAGNLRVIKRRLKPGTVISAVIKANAYGHGLVGMGRLLNRLGVDSFCVSLPKEAQKAIEGGVRGKILIMGSIMGSDFDAAPPFRCARVIASIGSVEEFLAVSEMVKRRPKPLKVHVKVDTGMGRRGIRWDEFPGVIDLFKRSPMIKIAGLMTHFAQSSRSNDPFTKLQIKRFNSVLNMLYAVGIRPSTVHAANSGAVFNYREAHYDLIRTGLALYGLAPFKGLVPIMSLTSLITQTKEIKTRDSVGYDREYVAGRKERIGVVPVGYADGFRRRYRGIKIGLVGPGGRVFRVPVVGAVSMDMLVVGLNSNLLPKNLRNRRVILFGNGRGKMRNAPTVRDIARRNNLIPYEVVTALADRVGRIYDT